VQVKIVETTIRKHQNMDTPNIYIIISILIFVLAALALIKGRGVNAWVKGLFGLKVDQPSGNTLNIDGAKNSTLKVKQELTGTGTNTAQLTNVDQSKVNGEQKNN
jgi:preprotein translocase subunit SecF